MNTVKVANAERMIIAVTPDVDGIKASFADGCNGKIPFKSIPEIKDRSGLDAVELPHPYETILTTTRDEKVELTWDFVRHYCGQTYRPKDGTHRRRGEAATGSESKGTQGGRWHDPGGPGNGSGHRASNHNTAGKRKARLKLSTLRAIARVLGSPVEDLLAGPDEPEENWQQPSSPRRLQTKEQDGDSPSHERLPHRAGALPEDPSQHHCHHQARAHQGETYKAASSWGSHVLLVKRAVSRWDGTANVVASDVRAIHPRVPMPATHDWR